MNYLDPEDPGVSDEDKAKLDLKTQEKTNAFFRWQLEKLNRGYTDPATGEHWPGFANQNGDELIEFIFKDAVMWDNDYLEDEYYQSISFYWTSCNIKEYGECKTNPDDKPDCCEDSSCHNSERNYKALNYVLFDNCYHHNSGGGRGEDGIPGVSIDYARALDDTNTGTQHELGHAFGIAHTCIMDTSQISDNFMNKDFGVVTIKDNKYTCNLSDNSGRDGGFLLDPIIKHDLTKIIEEKPNANTYVEGAWWDYSQVEVIMNHAKYYEMVLCK